MVGTFKKTQKMAPKKNATKNDIVPKGRPPKSKEKPILKIPTVVKIKFPLKSKFKIASLAGIVMIEPRILFILGANKHLQYFRSK